MKSLKARFNKRIPLIIQNIGYLCNPFLLNFVSENNRIAIFYFHGVYKNEKQKALNHCDPQTNITVDEFDEFINYFLNHDYIFIHPDNLSNGLDAGKRYAMLTFDDGYFNNSLAIDVLNKYNVSGTIFTSTRNVLENRSFWWDIVFKYRKKQGVCLEKIKQEQAYLKKCKHSFVESYIDQSFGSQSTNPWSDIDRPFTSAELKSISQNPLVCLGNHTHNHSILINYNKEEIKEELILCNQALYDITGQTPNTIAFPNGNFNKEVLDVTESLGFSYALTTQQNKNRLPVKQDGFTCLNRLTVTTQNIKNYGSFYRVGYHPVSLYSQMKDKLLFK